MNYKMIKKILALSLAFLFACPTPTNAMPSWTTVKRTGYAVVVLGASAIGAYGLFKARDYSESGDRTFYDLFSNLFWEMMKGRSKSEEMPEEEIAKRSDIEDQLAADSNDEDVVLEEEEQTQPLFKACKGCNPHYGDSPSVNPPAFNPVYCYDVHDRNDPFYDASAPQQYHAEYK